MREESFFMFFVAGISPKIKPLGMTSGCACPACKNISPLHVIYKYMTPHVFFIPTFRFHSEYIATCPNCASVMELQTEKGHAFRKDPDVRIETGDLRVLQNNRRGDTTL